MVHSSSPRTATSESPLVMRWVNSMRVFTLAECCKTVPLHSGQWFPQPAPAPVARTSVPHRITAIKYAKTAQAKRRKAAEGDLCAFFEAAEIVMEASRPPTQCKSENPPPTAAHHKQYKPFIIVQ